MLSHQELRELSSGEIEKLGLKRGEELSKLGYDTCIFDTEYASLVAAYVDVKRKEMDGNV